MPEYNITADSVPDYDSWGPDDYWSCQNWIDWHKAMKARYGKQEADQKWLNAWNDQDAFEANYNWCKYSASFNTYVNGEGLNVTHLLSDTVAGGTKVGENIIGGATNISKILKWLIPTLVILTAIGLIIYFGKRYKIFSLK